MEQLITLTWTYLNNMEFVKQINYLAENESIKCFNEIFFSFVSVRLQNTDRFEQVWFREWNNATDRKNKLHTDRFIHQHYRMWPQIGLCYIWFKHACIKFTQNIHRISVFFLTFFVIRIDYEPCEFETSWQRNHNRSIDRVWEIERNEKRKKNKH